MTFTATTKFQRFAGCRLLIRLLLVILVSPGWAMAEDEDSDGEEGDTVQSTYIEVQPAFVTNYGGADRLRYMKVAVTLRVLGVEGEEQVNHHMPYIKDALLGLFAVQTSSSIGSAEGKEELRQQALTSVSTILEDEDKTSYLQDLLFTSFVAHR